MNVAVLVPAALVVTVGVFLFPPSASSADRPWVIDGDTVAWKGQHIRIENLDAPEIGDRSRCPLERKRGYAAKRHAIRLMKQGSNFEVYGVDHIDRFGRTVARLRIDGRDFGELMIRAGVARSWRGRTSNWCG